MEATKYTMTITIQVLSIDSISALLHKCASEISREAIEGKLVFDDGDEIEWITEYESVKF